MNTGWYLTVTALLMKIGLVSSIEGHFALKAAIGGVVMIIQVIISLSGKATTFEKWTVPPTVAILLMMTIAAWGFMGIDLFQGVDLEEPTILRHPQL